MAQHVARASSQALADHPIFAVAGFGWSPNAVCGGLALAISRAGLDMPHRVDDPERHPSPGFEDGESRHVGVGGPPCGRGEAVSELVNGGLQVVTSPWDSLRRGLELREPRGNCLYT